MTKLTEAEIEKALAATPEWSEVSGEIQRTFEFANFREAMGFVNAIAEAADRAQHHPDIMIRYNRVTLSVSTHDAGGITSKDFDLAREADAAATQAS